jgi:hypothetical protein
MNFLKTALLAATLALCASAAQAHIIFSAGNNPGPNEENILFGSSQSGSLITGQTNQSGINVNFFTLPGGETSLSTQGIGQADIFCAAGCNPYGQGGANGAQLTALGISVQSGWGAKDFIGNLNFGEGIADIRVTDELGAIFDFQLGNGQNFFTLDAINNQVITQILITSAVAGQNFGFNDFKQPRISGLCQIGVDAGCGNGTPNQQCANPPCPVDVPEPATLPVFGFGLLAAGWYATRRRLKSVMA